MKSEVFQDRVYAFTPKGDVIDLPVGATAIDFAYHVHTDVGHRCRGAKVGGRLVPLSYQIKTGDQVEILTSSRGGPSMDWLNEALGYVKTSRAQSKIRVWFRKQNRDKHIAWGRDALERELKRLGVLDKLSFEAVARLFEYDKLEDFLAAIGASDVSGAQITQRVLDDERRRAEAENYEKEMLKPRTRASVATDSTGGVSIMGTGGLMVNLAKCCNPMPGDQITGYITRGRGVTVHRVDCPNMRAIGDTERLVDVAWGSASQEQRYSVPVEIIAHDREGLLRDITTIIADERVNITSVEVITRQHIATLHLKIDISSNQQLTRILARIECIPAVVDAHRRNQ
jgi:GTP pyrophosphokinase